MSRKDRDGYYDFVPAVVAGIERPPAMLARLVSWLVVVFCTIGITWLIVARVDIVVSARGNIVPAGSTRTIQAADHGVIKQIYTKEGALVKQGDNLLALDGTTPEADERQLMGRLARARLTVQRIRVELGEKVILGDAVDTSSTQISTEQAVLESNIASFEEQISLLRYELEQSGTAVNAAKAEYEKLAMTIQHLGSMVSKKQGQAELGLVPKSEVVDIEFELAAARQDLRAASLQIQQQQSRATGSAEKIEALKLENRSGLFKELAEAEHDLEVVQQELIKARERIDYQVIKAPVAGVVQRILIDTTGAVVTKADTLMTIVPAYGKLDMEADILNKDIGFVKADEAVQVKIDAFEYTRFGSVPGTIEWLGADAVVDKNKGAVYPARISLKETTLPKVVGDRVARVLPGMSATVDIVIGQRRLIEYFLGPVLRYRDEALNER